MALDAIEQLLVANHGFTVTPEGAVVSPSGQVRNVVDGKTVFTPYTPPTTEPTFAEQFAAQQAQAIADTNQVRQDEAIASGQDTYQSVATDGSGAVTDVSVGTPVAIQPLPPDDFMPGLPSAPTQTREELESALNEAVQTDTDTFTYSGDKTGKTVTFDDGSVLTQKGYSFQYEDADGNPIELDTTGLKASSDSKNDALSTVVGGIKRDLTEDVYGDFGGEGGALVSEYLADEAAAERARQKKDERSDERDQERFDALRNKVKDEARSLNLSLDEYYDLPLSQRLSMASADIREVFDPSQGGLFDKDSGRALGTLGSENLATATKAAKDYYADIDTSADSPFFNIPDVSGAVDDPMYGVGVYTPPDDDVSDAINYAPSLDDMDAMYNAQVTESPLMGGLNIPGTNLTITAGDPVGPGAGSNTGGGGPSVGGGGDTGDTGGDDTGGIGVGVPVIGPGVIGGGTGGGDTGGGGIGGGVPVAGTKPDPSTYIVPSTANYGEDPRFANLAPTYNVSKAAMPVFNRLDPAPSIPPVSAGQTLPEGYKIINGQVYQDPNVYTETDAGIVGTQLALNPVGSPPTSLLAEGGIVSLAEGGAPMDQVAKDFFIRQIPRALTEKDGGGLARKLANIHDVHDLGIDEDTFLALKYYRGPGGMKHGGVAERGYSHEGVGSLSDTARNMFRPMVS